MLLGLITIALIGLRCWLAVLLHQSFVLPIDDTFDLHCRFFEDFVHLDREDVFRAEELEGKIACLLICKQCRLILLQVFILHCDVMQRYNHNCLARLWRLCLANTNLKELILNQNQRLHCVVQGKFVFAQLTENSANVEVNLTRIGDHQRS